MISEKAKQSFVTTLARALDDALGDLTGEIETETNQLESASEITEDEFSMLTISSYQFRVIFMLHFTITSPIRHYLADRAHIELQQMTDERCYDYLGEVGNAICGSIKRDLGHHFMHIGMSVPYRMDTRSMAFVENLHYDHELHMQAQVGEEVGFHASLFVCSYGNLDFELVYDEDESLGELELF